MTFVIQLTHTEEGTVMYYAPDGPSGGYPYKTGLKDAYCFSLLEDAYLKINNEPNHSFFSDPFEKVEICELLVAPVPTGHLLALDDKAALDIYRTLTPGQKEAMELLMEREK